MMIGVKGKPGSLFSRRHTAMPSTFGIMMSSRMRSGLASRASASVSSPSCATQTSYPWRASLVSSMRTFAGVSSATRMRAGSLKLAGVYSPRPHAARSHRPARGFATALAHRSAGRLGGARARLGAAQAAGRVPAHHAALHRHGGLQPAHHARHDSPERASGPRSSAARMVTADPSLARHADAPDGHGAAGAR